MKTWNIDKDLDKTKPLLGVVVGADLTTRPMPPGTLLVVAMPPHDNEHTSLMRLVELDTQGNIKTECPCNKRDCTAYWVYVRQAHGHHPTPEDEERKAQYQAMMRANKKRKGFRNKGRK